MSIPTVWNGHDYMNYSYPELRTLLQKANDEATLTQLALCKMSNGSENLATYRDLPYRKPDVIQSAMLTKIKNGEFY